MQNRLIYQNWIAELGLDPALIRKLVNTVIIDSDDVDKIGGEVRRAIEGLREEEMEFIIRFYFMGQGYNAISEKSGKAFHKLETLHKRAIRKLRNRLQAFVKNHYGLSSKRVKMCPICKSPFRIAIEQMAANRSPSSTWRPILTAIYKEFGLKIKYPQVLIAHQKCHRN